MILGWLLATSIAIAAPVQDKAPPIASPTTAPATPDDQAKQKRHADLTVAVDAMVKDNEPERAITLIEPVLASYDAEFSDKQNAVYCASKHEDTMFFLSAATMAADASVDKHATRTYVLDLDWCQALWLKGYALSDLQRYAEAEPYLRRAAEMAPREAQFLCELGFAKLRLRQPQAALQLYKDAEPLAEGTGELRDYWTLKSWFGQAYALIDLGKLDEAEDYLDKMIKLDPGNEKATNELKYIAEQRKKAA